MEGGRDLDAEYSQSMNSAPPPTLPDQPESGDLHALVPYYQTLLISVMAWIAERYERHPEYPFIDTKIDLMSGEEFGEEDPVRDRGTVYSYIQGRGLEALAGHCRWLRRVESPDAARLVPRLERILRETLGSLQRLRRQNGGHMAFFMTPDGTPFTLDEHGQRRPFVLGAEAPYSLSDLFCSKGMYAAAAYLGDDSVRQEALEYCKRTAEALWDRTFVHDQQPLDPKNPVAPVPGRHSQGPFMLSLGTAALLTDGEGDQEPLELGLALIQHILARHVNLNGARSTFAAGDFWEFIDDTGEPYKSGGAVPSDPGHALEFVGLTLRFVSAAFARPELTNSMRRQLHDAVRHMPLILKQNFENGFRPAPQGICKSFDLVGRRPINADMPWWSLPEAMRAAAYCWRFAQSDADRTGALRVLSACHHAFAHHFVRPELYYNAYQTRDENGQPVHVIPATADADPGYHTGLSIIDMLEIIEHA